MWPLLGSHRVNLPVMLVNCLYQCLLITCMNWAECNEYTIHWIDTKLTYSETIAWDYHVNWAESKKKIETKWRQAMRVNRSPVINIFGEKLICRLHLKRLFWLCSAQFGVNSECVAMGWKEATKLTKQGKEQTRESGEGVQVCRVA